VLHAEQEITTFSFRRSSHLLLHVKDGTTMTKYKKPTVVKSKASRLIDPKQKTVSPWSAD